MKSIPDTMEPRHKLLSDIKEEIEKELDRKDLTLAEFHAITNKLKESQPITY